MDKCRQLCQNQPATALPDGPGFRRSPRAKVGDTSTRPALGLPVNLLCSRHEGFGASSQSHRFVGFAVFLFCVVLLCFSVPFRYWLALKPSDVMWNMSDNSWIKAAFSSLFAPWLLGACVFVHGMPQFDAETLLDTLARYPITTLCTAPTVYRMLVQKDLQRYLGRMSTEPHTKLSSGLTMTLGP